MLRGLAGLDAVPEAMAADLDANWEVLGEPVQSAMRALGAQGVPGMDNPYERLKDYPRPPTVTTCASSPAGWACPTTSPSGCPMTPATYIGVACSSSTTSTEDHRRSRQGQLAAAA